MRNVSITYLEMNAPPSAPERATPRGVTIMQAHAPTVTFYRFLYDTVGEPWQWKDRRLLDPDDLRAIIEHPDVEVHVLYFDGTPAGYAELDARKMPDVQLAYFGLMPEFIGRGLGTFFLDWAIRKAWERAPERLWVHTCTLDHPSALPLYKRMGFAPYKQEEIPA
ncbi:MAG: GNAT family N-acetyltransferase [Rhodothermales bacterium]